MYLFTYLNRWTLEANTLYWCGFWSFIGCFCLRSSNVVQQMTRCARNKTTCMVLDQHQNWIHLNSDAPVNSWRIPSATHFFRIHFIRFNLNRIRSHLNEIAAILLDFSCNMWTSICCCALIRANFDANKLQSSICIYYTHWQMHCDLLYWHNVFLASVNRYYEYSQSFFVCDKYI